MRIGNGNFLLGDALEIMKNISDESIDLIVTDPPYKVISGGTKSHHAHGWKTSVLSKNDGKIFKHNDVKIEEYLPEFFRILKNNSDCYIMTNNLNLNDLLNLAQKVGFKFHGLLFWKKNTATANRWYMKNVELTCYFYKGNAKPIRNMGSKQTFECDNPTNKKHPTEKPIELMKYYIENSSEPADLILDPFAGSCSSGIAAQQTNRRWLCIEKDEQYYYSSIARMI